MRQPDPLMHSAIFRPLTREEIEWHGFQKAFEVVNRAMDEIIQLQSELDGAMHISKEYADALEESLRKRK